MSPYENYQAKQFKDLHESRVGEVHNELIVIRFVGNSKYEFQCSCGITCIKNYHDVRKGKTKSCGHINESRKFPNLVGEKFNKLTAIEELEFDENNQRLYLFKCDCGDEVIRRMKDVKRGKLMSCGCSMGEGAGAPSKHGLSKTRIYGIHKGMLRRCYTVYDDAYEHYGGRGIIVCDEWRGEKGVSNFIEWSESNGYSEELTIDRIDNNKGYSPDNCRWANRIIQQNNKSDNLIFKHNDKTQTLAEWARDLNLTYDSLWKRIYKYDYSFEKAITYKLEGIKASNYYGTKLDQYNQNIS